MSEVKKGVQSADRMRVSTKGTGLLATGARYFVLRCIVVFLTVLTGIYAAIWVTNLGGYADRQRAQEIEVGVRMGFIQSGALSGVPAEQRTEMIRQAVASAIVAADLDQPFLARSFRYFRDALTFSLGLARRGTLGETTERVVDILLDKLPMTILLFGVANTLTFFGGLFIALALSLKHGSFLDRMTALLVPLFAAPPWFHGIFLIVIFAAIAKILPFGGIVDSPIPATTIGYVLSVLKHMILPVTAILLGTLPYAVYSNRALFLIHSSEDYVELAKAKGLSPSRVRIRYILRPVLPTIITNFVLVSLVAWQGVVLTEAVFNWPGIGSLLITGILSNQTSLIIGTVTVFAYLLGLSVLLLDFLYVLVDPRLKLGGRRRER